MNFDKKLHSALNLFFETSVYGVQPVGSGTLEHELINALDPVNFKKNQANVDRLPHKQLQALPRRSGNQDTPMKGRHRTYFNAPAPGTEKKMAFPTGAEAVGTEEDEFEIIEPLEPLDQDTETYEDQARGLQHQFDDEEGFKGSHVIDRWAARG